MALRRVRMNERDTALETHLRLQGEKEARRAEVVALVTKQNEMRRRSLAPYAADLPGYVDPLPPTGVGSHISDDHICGRGARLFGHGKGARFMREWSRFPRSAKIKSAGYCASVLSVALLSAVSWKTASTSPVLAICLFLGAATSVCGMGLRWWSYEIEETEKIG